jgi:Cys-tRNA(Pro)/Cys-tRNA(Cys) deacylase
MSVNNVTRMLISKKIPYEVYELPAEKLGAQKTARLLNVPLEQVCKTIVIKRARPGKHILAIIPGNRSAQLKFIAEALGEKKVVLPTQNEAESITGLQAGGISPLALLNKGFQVLIDQSLSHFDEIHVSAGQRGLNLKIRLNDLISLTNAKVAPISELLEDSELD